MLGKPQNKYTSRRYKHVIIDTSYKFTSNFLDRSNAFKRFS